MKVSIFGLGTSCGVRGVSRTGVDRAKTKVDLINAGQSPIIEAEIGEFIAAGVRAGRLRVETIVVGNKDPDFRTIPEHLHDRQCLVDLASVTNNRSNNSP